MKNLITTITIHAAGKTFGRVASTTASFLQSKHKASYVRNAEPSTHVIVSNISKITFSGKKITQKKYYKHSSYPGGLTVSTLQASWQKNPTAVFRKTVERMLPKNRLKKKMLSHLTITL